MNLNSAQRYQVLDDEPASRLPVCLLIDKSYSMNVVTGGERTGETVYRDGQTYELVKGGGGKRIDQLLSAVGVFADDILRDVRARASVELAIVSFGESVTIERDFLPVDENVKQFTIKATGDSTRLGQAIRTGLQLLDRRKEDYSEYGIDYYQPQLVILTDGEATDSDICAQHAKDVQSRMASGKLICLPFLVGDSTGARELARFGWKSEVFNVAEVNLASLFKYLSQSAIQLSRSTAGGTESVTLEKMLEGLRNATKNVGEI